MNGANVNRRILKRTRRAIFMLELGLAMAISSVLLGIALVLLASLLRADPSNTIGNTTTQELDRFTDRLRHDLHRAQQVTMPQPTELLLKTPTGDIVYELRDRQCLRRERAADAERVLPFAIDAKSWNLSGGEEPMRIAIVEFDLPPKRTSQLPIPITVAAQLGKFAPERVSPTEEQ